MSWLFSAFAAALATTLNSGRAAACGANRRMSRASPTGRPLISATTRRTFVGDMCTYLATARARAGSSTAAGESAAAVMSSLSFCSSRDPHSLADARSAHRERAAPVIRSHARSSTARLAVVLDVAPERAGGRELPQLVADHRVGHEHRHVLAAVVHGDRVADHVRDDGGPAGPGPDHGLLARLVEGVHLLEQVVVHEGALLQAARHLLPPCSALLAGAAPADDQLVGRLGAAGAALGLAGRVHRVDRKSTRLNSSHSS